MATKPTKKKKKMKKTSYARADLVSEVVPLTS